MLFQDWGEEEFIQYLAREFPTEKKVMGIGDDCAVIPASSGMAFLITTDALVEGVHFSKMKSLPLIWGLNRLPSVSATSPRREGSPNTPF